MTKNEFVKRVYRNIKTEYAITADQVQWWVDTILKELIDAILDEDCVKLLSLGSFEKVMTTSKVYHDLVHGEKVSEPHYKLRYSISPVLKKAIRNGFTSEEYREWIEATNALRRGEYVPGWVMMNDGFGAKIDGEGDDDNGENNEAQPDHIS